MNPGYVSLFVFLVGLLCLGAELLAALTAVHAIMTARTSQGAVAWVICLFTLPLVALPIYWVFGRSKFQGYIKARRGVRTELLDLVRDVVQDAQQRGLVRQDPHGDCQVLEKLARMPFTRKTRMPFTRKNRVRLLIDGRETFDAIFAGIEAARRYVLVQFFIVRDDQLGRQLKARLLEKAARNVPVYFLYDEIGSYRLPKRYIRQLKVGGVRIHAFHTTKGRRNRFQLNFRNHRKIVVADGRQAFVGGVNVGDEYRGCSKRFGPWRDTEVKIEGPAVHAVQFSFLEDWHWATGELPELDWTIQPAEGGDQDVLVLPTGPADRLESCGMSFVHLINIAKRRVWIASPYFVPDLHVVSALQLAAMRGVDVRIMLPEKPDHLLVYLSAFSYLDEADDAGVKVYRYQQGFMHHKVILVDDQLAGVGTANLDNRSFRLNFEITILVDDRGFNQEVAAMFERDFSRSKAVKADEFKRRPFWFRLAARAARLMAPVQ